MAPIPITFHAHPASRGSQHSPLPKAVGGRVKSRSKLYYSVTRPKDINTDQSPTAGTLSMRDATGSDNVPATTIAASTTTAAAAATGPSNSASTSASVSSTSDPLPPSKPSARRKPLARRAPSTPSTSGYITITPRNSFIIDRCLLHTSTVASGSSSSSPRGASHHNNNYTKGQATQYHPVHPYSPMTDLANNRSPNPSPREIIRAARASEEQAQAKKDSAAAARAAIAAKRKKGKAGGKNTGGNGAVGNGNGKGKEKESYSNGTARSPSPSDAGRRGKDGSGAIPTITTTNASSSSTSANGVDTKAPFNPNATSRSLKRSWSSGLAPVSTGLANLHGTGNLGIGSPLKAVMGANDGDGNGDSEESRRAKRSRTDEPMSTALPMENGQKGNSQSNGNDVNGTERKKSLSPTSASLGNPRKSSRDTGHGVAIGLGVAGTSAGGTSMRRAVSAAGVSASAGAGNIAGSTGSRRGSSGSQGSEGAASLNLRSRREVNLPKSLRDYEMRAGTGTTA